MRRRFPSSTFVGLSRSIAVVLSLALLEPLGSPAARADFTIKGPVNGDPKSVMLTKCPDGDVGRAWLDPEKVSHLAPADKDSLLAKTFAADLKQYEGWTLAFGGGVLTGVLTIDDYYARDRPDKADCAGGARMVATYAPGDKDPKGLNLTFMQVFTDNYGSGTHIDPFPNDDKEPFYYTEDERKKNGLTFNDNPWNQCTKKDFTYENRFYTYLVSFTDKTATVYDGWTWGYDVRCAAAPEPSSFVVATVAGGVLTLLGLRRRPGRRIGSDGIPRDLGSGSTPRA